MKKILFFLLLITIAFISAFLYFKKETQNKNFLVSSPLPQINNQITKLPFEESFKPNSGVIFSLSASGSQFPEKLPIYRASYQDIQIVKNNLLSFVQSLNITSSPKEIGPVGKRTFVWSSSNIEASLSESPRSFFISAQNFDSYNKTVFENKSPKQIIDYVFKSVFQTPQTISLKLLEQSSDSSMNGSTLPEGTVINSQSYQLIFNDLYSLFLNPNRLGCASVQIADDSLLTSFSLPLTPDKIELLKELSVLKNEELLNSLNQGLGTLVETTNQSKKAVEVKPEFTEVNIKTINLAYYLLPNEPTLIPIFVISGIGVGNGKSQNVQFILPAVVYP